MFPPKTAICRQSGGGGNRTREPGFPDHHELQGECVYFIQEGTRGPIKIGVTQQSASGRLEAFQVANWRPLRLLGAFAAPAGTERRLHERLAEHRIRGEWFAASDAVHAVIENCFEAYVIGPLLGVELDFAEVA